MLLDTARRGWTHANAADARPDDYFALGTAGQWQGVCRPPAFWESPQHQFVLAV